MSTTDKDLERVRRLIDEAAAQAGSEYRLAQLLKYSRGNINDWKHGKRSCPVQAQALMADLAGLSAQEVACYVVIEQEKNPERKERLLEVLGKGFSRMSAACLALISASGVWGSKPALAAEPALHDV